MRLGHLSPDSGWQVTLRAQGPAPGERVIEDPAEAEAFMRMLAGS